LFIFRGATLTEPISVDGNYRTSWKNRLVEDADVYACGRKNQNALVDLLERYLPLFAYRTEI
jgi:hypothetical protein